MEDLFSTIFPLIPIAIFIALRIASSKKKQAAAEERKKLVQLLAESAAPAAPAVSARAIVADDAFDAHALKPDDDEPKPLPAKRPQQKPKPQALSSFSRTASVPAFDSRPLSEVSLPTDHSTTVKSVALEATASKDPAARTTFAARLDALPPLKKAVVFAELLGTPKSL